MNFHSENILRYIFFIFKIIIVYILLLFNDLAFAQNKIGSVTAIEGSAISINTNDEERELSIFDSIYTNDEIFVSEDSTLTIQYLDNTTIILKEFTNLNVYEFEKSEILEKFNANCKQLSTANGGQHISSILHEYPTCHPSSLPCFLPCVGRRPASSILHCLPSDHKDPIDY